MAIQPELFTIEAPSQATRRSSMEVMCEILEVIASGVERPTHIIYHANISWKVLNGLLKNLLKNDLLTKENDGKRAVYKMTDKGYTVLHLYKDLRERLQTAEQPLQLVETPRF